MKIRCEWPGDDPLMTQYHDEEWGVPKHDDRRLFEDLVLDGAHAGLSWITILRKRENYRQAFDEFDPIKVAAGLVGMAILATVTGTAIGWIGRIIAADGAALLSSIRP